MARLFHKRPAPDVGRNDLISRSIQVSWCDDQRAPYFVEVAVGKEKATADEMMRLASSQAFDALD